MVILSCQKSCIAKKDEKKEDMENVHYSSVIGSLMYVMVSIRPNIAHVEGVVGRFISNPGKEN